MVFPLVGESLALDLANTVIRERGAERDLIAEADGLDAWMGGHAHQLPPGQVDAHRLRQLRDALREVFAAHAEQRRPLAAAVALVDDAARPGANARLHAGEQGPQVRWAGHGTPAVLATIAQDALTQILSGPAVRACENPDCLLHFLAHDLRRRFCSTARCSNRARQARHRARGEQER